MSGRPARVTGFGRVNTDGFFTIPVTLDLHAMLVETAAAVTVAEMVRVVILKSFFCHPISLLTARLQ
jgi:uncharacterized membrane protein